MEKTLTVTSTVPPQGAPVDPSMIVFFSEREGWGKNATGGAAGTVWHVTSLADTGPGTLREALLRPEALWIVFDLDGDIIFHSAVTPMSNKTIDGRGRNVNIRTSNHYVRPLMLINSNNIIIVGMRFEDGWPNYTYDSEGSDAINIVTSKTIWIHHNTFSQWRDSIIDMGSKGAPSEISITWNKFSKTYQALNFTADKVSFGHNYCYQISSRCIQMINGKGHSYNNLIVDWKKDQIQNAKDGAQIYSQYNLWSPSGYNYVNSRKNGGKIANKNHFVTKAVVFLGGSDGISAPADGSNVAKCTNSSCWNALKTTLETKAGKI